MGLCEILDVRWDKQFLGRQKRTLSVPEVEAVPSPNINTDLTSAVRINLPSRSEVLVKRRATTQWPSGCFIVPSPVAACPSAAGWFDAPLIAVGTRNPSEAPLAVP
jgi:hypothetical protein